MPSAESCQVTGLKPGDFVHSFGEAHVYVNHLEQARLQLTRPTRPLPVMKFDPAFRYEDFVLEGYDRTRKSRPRTRCDQRRRFQESRWSIVTEWSAEPRYDMIDAITAAAIRFSRNVISGVLIDDPVIYRLAA